MRVLWWIPLLHGCGIGSSEPVDPYGPAHSCSAVGLGGSWLVSTGDSAGFTAETPADATPFRMQPADLGTYVLYGPDAGYLVVDGEGLARRTEVASDMTEVDDRYVSEALWDLSEHPTRSGHLALRNLQTQRWLGPDGTTDEDRRAARITLDPTEGCADYPELSVDAEGQPARTTWDDGELYGFVDAHSHLLTNYGFGGGMFHGAPFHPLGVPHAMGDCDRVHGEMGRQDFFGYVYDNQGNGGDLSEVLPYMAAGELPFDNHDHRGFPTFADWPDTNRFTTHQTQYYRWIERSWLAGLRLVVQHATSNAVVCNITVGEGWAPSRYDCEDMTAVDRQLDAAYDMERYIDAQHGGPGQGWFRIVTTPAEARQVIEDGKLAVVLGIEVSDLFDCHLTPRPDGPVCDEAYVDAQLDHYFERGVRVLFPNHKYDNAFTPGDGSGGFIEVGNFINTGHYTNKVEDCPDGVPTTFDGGAVSFSALLEPREDYLGPAPEDFSDLVESPLETLLPHFGLLLGGGVDGQYCQNGSLTDVGEHLIDGMIEREMIVEVDHLPQWSYVRAIELLEAADHPAVGTHGRDYDGRIFALGGTTFGSFATCHDPSDPGGAIEGFSARLARKVAAGGHASLGFGFDYNGLAGGPRPRFGEASGCADQTDPVTYPFSSFDGGVTFTEPRAGDRVFDYATEGMAHIGLIPEYIQDVRNDGATDEELEPLFRSAEGYVRIWEKATGDR